MDSFGNNFRVSVFGESHGPVVGVLIDGVPPGIKISQDDFAESIKRRSAHAGFTSTRSERDIPEFLSGICNDYTTGTSLCIVFRNENIQSQDYSFLPDTPRPGHADYPAHIKYAGFEDWRGGGHFSGRLTLPIVAAGVVARKLLPSQIAIRAEITRLGGSQKREDWPELLKKAQTAGDSLGGVVSCTMSGVPVGVGEPFWNGLESVLSHALFAIPGVRGVEFGDGFAASDMMGSQHNDEIGADGPISNGAGGVNGGLANGNPITLRVAFKPTSSINKLQRTFNFATRKESTLSIGGRHDVCFALRTPVIVESMCAIALADLTL